MIHLEKLERVVGGRASCQTQHLQLTMRDLTTRNLSQEDGQFIMRSLTKKSIRMDNPQRETSERETFVEIYS